MEVVVTGENDEDQMVSECDSSRGTHRPGLCRSWSLHRRCATAVALRGGPSDAGSRLCMDCGLLELGRWKVRLGSWGMEKAALCGSLLDSSPLRSLQQRLGLPRRSLGS